MNDLGNFLVAGHLLWRPSIFCQEEREKVQGHTLAGFSLLQQGDSPLFQQGAKIALSHHEHFDGKGYPHGFGGQDIPLEARIVSVADFVDALLSDRPYRKAWSVDKMLGYLKSYRGKRFESVRSKLEHRYDKLALIWMVSFFVLAFKAYRTERARLFGL